MQTRGFGLCDGARRCVAWSRFVVVGLVAPVAAAESVAFQALAEDGATGHQPTVNLVVTGDELPARTIAAALLGDRTLPVRFEHRDAVPDERTNETTRDDLANAVVVARKHYVAGDFAACLRALGPESAAETLLLTNAPARVADVVTFRVACLVANGDSLRAQREAEHLFVLELEHSRTAELHSPEAESLVEKAKTRVRAKSRVPLAVRTEPPGAALTIDGRPQACRTPCTLLVYAGIHAVLLESDGMVSIRQAMAVGADSDPVTIRLSAASPDVAWRDWSLRYARSQNADSEESLRLLFQAANRPHTLWMHVAASSGAWRLRAILLGPDAAKTRTERDGVLADDVANVAVSLAHELVVTEKLVEPAPVLVARPWFWVAIGIAAVGAAVLGVALSRPTRREVEIVF